MATVVNKDIFSCPSSSFELTRSVVVAALTNIPTSVPTRRPTLIDIHSRMALEQRLVQMQAQIEKMEDGRSSPSSLARGVLTTRVNDAAHTAGQCKTEWHCGRGGCYTKAIDADDCRDCADGYTRTAQWKDDTQVQYYSCSPQAIDSTAIDTHEPTTAPAAPHPTAAALNHLRVQLCVHYNIKPCKRLSLSNQQLAPVLECLSRQILVGGNKPCLTISAKAAIARAKTAEAWAQPPAG
jgi:hypothetical protein